MLYWIQQIGILVPSLIAMGLVGFRQRRVRRWAYVSGMIGQPFWMWMAVETRQWAVFLVAAWYTIMWSRGFWTHWIQR